MHHILTLPHIYSILPIAAGIATVLHPSQARELGIAFGMYRWQRKLTASHSDGYFRVCGVLAVVVGILVFLYG